MKYLPALFLFVFFSCSSDDNSPDVKPNSPPSSISINEISFEGRIVTIDWSDSQDPDGDLITYKLFINSILITETEQSLGSAETIYNSAYEGRIIGTDKKGGAVELNFQFDSPKSKLLFYSEANGNLTAFDLLARNILWQKRTSFIETHTVYNDLIYSGINGINGFDLVTGETKWSSTPSQFNNAEYRNILVDDTNVYAFDSDSDLYCVDRITGVKKWDRSFLNYYAPLSIDQSSVYVCSRNNDHIYAIDKITGETNWSFELDSNNISAAPTIDTNPLIINENIYFGDNIGTFYSLNKNTGMKNWSVNAGQFNSFYPSPTLFNETVVIGTYSNLYAYDKDNGSLKWEYVPNGSFQTSPFIYNDKVYIGVSQNGKGELICLNANNGVLVWRFGLENNTTSSPVVYENVVYIWDWSKNFYAVNSNTGILDWKRKTDEVVIKSPTIVLGEGETIIYPSIHGLKN